MKLLFIGTVNGKYDEGMRNVATHIGKGLEREHTVRYIRLRDFTGIMKNVLWCDQAIVCARADKKLYWLVRVLSCIRKISVILVQKPDDSFLSLYDKTPLQCLFFTIALSDALCIPHLDKTNIVKIPVGIDSERFRPVSEKKQDELKHELGIPSDKCCVLHVGHCSSGRRIEKLCGLNRDVFERIVITSGMFEDENIRHQLEMDGVRILNGYLPNIEKYYQAADVYFFPTISGEFVISIPLSVMEALSCGTPVVGYKQLPGLKEIEISNEQDMLLISDEDDISKAVMQQAEHKANECMLVNPVTWGSAAGIVSGKLEER